jgi:hypothetical protein
MSGFEPMEFKELRCCVKRSDGRPCGRQAVKVMDLNHDIVPVCEAHRITESMQAVQKKEDWEARFKSLVQELDGLLRARSLWAGSYHSRDGARLIQAFGLALEKMDGLKTRVEVLEARLGERKAVPGVKEDAELRDWSVVRKETGPAYGEE